jgi:hypothetical protein
MKNNHHDLCLIAHAHFIKLNIFGLMADDLNLHWLLFALKTCGKTFGLNHAAKLLTQTQKKKF